VVSAATTRSGPGGLAFIDLENAFGRAEVCTQGAQLVAWQPRGAAHPVTFASAAMQYRAGRSLRGGIPICWPWFGPHPADSAQPAHGFVRNLTWDAAAPRQLPGGETQLALQLRDSATTRAVWPHEFLLECRITVGAELGVELLTTNAGSAPFIVTEALHTYFFVADVAAIEVTGLDGAQYADKADGGVRKRQSGAVAFHGEVDRAYVGTTAACTITDPLLGRRILIAKEGSRSTIVWNPGPQKAAQLADLGAADDPQRRGGWRQLVCVESGNALDDAVTVAPGATHRLAVRYRAEAL
jgi:D-hexose-6-phosphate mutarotase